MTSSNETLPGSTEAAAQVAPQLGSSLLHHEALDGHIQLGAGDAQPPMQVGHQPDVDLPRFGTVAVSQHCLPNVVRYSNCRRLHRMQRALNARRVASSGAQ